MSAAPGSEAKVRSTAAAWVVLLVSLAGLAGVYAWAFENVIPAPSSSLPLADAEAVVEPDIEPAAGSDVEPITEPAARPDATPASVREVVSSTSLGSDVPAPPEDDAAEPSVAERDVPEPGAIGASARSSIETRTEPVETTDGAPTVRPPPPEIPTPKTASDDGEARPASPGEPIDSTDALRFAFRSAALEPAARAVLDGIAIELLDRPDAPVTVEIAGNEHRDEARDRVLNRERARAIIAGLVNRGVSFERLSMGSIRSGGLAPGSQRVRVLVVPADG